MTEQQPDGPDLGPVMGMGGEDVRLRLGLPVSDRVIGRERWLVYSSELWRLRLRLAPLRDSRIRTVRSWTLELEDGGADLPAVLKRIGLSAVGRIGVAPGSGGRLLRCAVASTDRPVSLTARLRDGAITSVTLFDEAPEWSEAAP